MKRFFYIIIAVLLSVSVASAQGRWHGGFHGGYHGHGCGAGWFLGGMFVGAVLDRVCYERPVVVERQVIVESSPSVVFENRQVAYSQPTGHWEIRIVGYQTVLQPVYHPAVYKSYWVGNQYVQYVAVEAYTEMVPTQVPITQQVWVNP